MNKSFIFGGMFFIGVIIFGTYFFLFKNNEADLLAQQDKLQKDLAIAQNALKKEEATLETMTNNLKSSFAIAFSVQEQMKKGGDIVGQTDFMFTDANGLNPKLILKNFPTIFLTNKARLDVNLILKEWQKKIDILFLNQIDIKESDQIKKDAETIKNYIKDLSSFVNILTPENSGLPQKQIDSYKESLPSVSEIDEVLESLQEAIDNLQTSNNQNSSSSTLDAYSVSAEDVAAQQQVVDQIKNEVESLQEQIAEIQTLLSDTVPAQTPDTNSLPSDNSVVPETNPVPSVDNSDNNNNAVDTSTETNTTNQSDTTSTQNQNAENTNNVENNTDSVSTYDNYTVDYDYNSNKDKPIIIQEGPVQLIQGSNQY